MLHSAPSCSSSPLGQAQSLLNFSLIDIHQVQKEREREGRKERYESEKEKERGMSRAAEIEAIDGICRERRLSPEF